MIKSKDEARKYLIQAIKNKEPYQCYEKVDGSLGILYLDPADNTWKFATRGSFQSDQAKKATDIFHTNKGFIVPEHGWKSLPQYHKYTLLVEIIYPENRVNPGARLVIDYGSKETLVILGAIDKVTGKDIHDWDLEIISEATGLPLAKKYNYTIEEMIELQKTLPATQEGFVVKYASGFRVKIKGHEYLKMHRILNSITPLFIWELMSENKDFKLSDEYRMSIPEEILPELEEIELKLGTNYLKAMTDIGYEFQKWERSAFPPDLMDQKSALKSLGLYTQNPYNNLKHPKILFAYYKKDMEKIRKYVLQYIRPTANSLEMK